MGYFMMNTCKNRKKKQHSGRQVQKKTAYGTGRRIFSLPLSSCRSELCHRQDELAVQHLHPGTCSLSPAWAVETRGHARQ